MSSVLYVFPHPDDESFGPAPMLARQRRQGHDVHLLTLTRGEATSQRERLGYTKAEMAEVRYEEMQGVAEALDLTSMEVLEYPDGQLAELNPLELEQTVAEHIHRTEPDVVVTYPVHGVSGHPDHLVAHAVVKRVAAQMRADGVAYPRRVAFFTLAAPPEDADRPAHLRHSPDALIDVVVQVSDDDLARGHDALDCYVTYKPVIDEHQPLSQVPNGLHLELWGEDHDPPLNDLFADLAEPSGARA
jgi:LmbE family N-acetylglucosaminyl deacetylase